MKVVTAAMEMRTFSLVNFFLAAMPLGLFCVLLGIDLLHVLVLPNAYIASWGLLIHAIALGLSFLLSLPKIIGYMSTLPSYNKKKHKVTMSFQEVLCTVAVSIYSVTFLFRWASVLPIHVLVWPEGMALLIMLIANKRRFVFTAHFLGKTVRRPFSDSSVSFIQPSHKEAA